MGRIRGHYEWDDDDLRPGMKAEGGLHQNLFDDEGRLRGSARFVPDDDGSDPLIITETVYVPAEERRLTREDQELADTLAELLTVATALAIARAAPHVKQWWRRAVVRPMQAKRAERVARRRESVTAIEEPQQPSPTERSDTTVTLSDTKPEMSFAEAQARYLAALAAQAYSEDQLRLIAGSRIVGVDDDRVEIGHALAALPRDQVMALLKQMVKNPSMLSDDQLALLASSLGRARISTTPAPRSTGR